MATLYKLNDEYARLMAELDFADTEEDAAHVWTEIDQIEASIADKADAYARILRNKQAEAEMYKAEKQRFEKLQKSAENAVERMKSVMLETMQLTGDQEMVTSIGKWRRQLNNPSVVIEDETAIPTDFRVPQPDKIDKVAILKHYKATGELVDGIDVVRTESVRFR